MPLVVVNAIVVVAFVVALVDVVVADWMIAGISARVRVRERASVSVAVGFVVGLVVVTPVALTLIHPHSHAGPDASMPQYQTCRGKCTCVRLDAVFL